jgi:hypothetical protein
MSKKHTIFFLTILLILCSFSNVNGSYYEVQVTITENGQDLQAAVSGMFMFSGATFNVPNSSTDFPVPPDANNIEITASGSVPWTWSINDYETLFLPEQPLWPMIHWDLPYFSGTFPITITYCVNYEHTLIKRAGEFILFYANESSEFPGYPSTPHGLFSAEDFTIDFPQGYAIKGVWSKDIPLQFQIVGNQLTFSVDDLTADRITVLLRPPCNYTLAGDLNDDCIVNFIDFAVMANNWLVDCIENPDNPECVPK